MTAIVGDFNLPNRREALAEYFPAGTFDSLSAFTGILNALENAFIGPYLNAIQEFAAKSANAKSSDGAWHEPADGAYSTEQLDYFAKVAASVMGIEAEHCVLGRVISNIASEMNWKVWERTNEPGTPLGFDLRHVAGDALAPRTAFLAVQLAPNLEADA